MEEVGLPIAFRSLSGRSYAVAGASRHPRGACAAVRLARSIRGPTTSKLHVHVSSE